MRSLLRENSRSVVCNLFQILPTGRRNSFTNFFISLPSEYFWNLLTSRVATGVNSDSKPIDFCYCFICFVVRHSIPLETRGESQVSYFDLNLKSKPLCCICWLVGCLVGFACRFRGQWILRTLTFYFYLQTVLVSSNSEAKRSN